MIHDGHVRTHTDKEDKEGVLSPKGIMNDGTDRAQNRPDCMELGFVNDTNGVSSGYTVKVNGSSNGYSNGHGSNGHGSNGSTSSSTSGSSSSGHNGHANGNTNGNSSSRLIHSNGGTSSNSSSSNSSESGYVLDTATTSLCNGHNNGTSTNADYGNSRSEGKLIGWRGETREWEAPHTFTVKMQLWEIWQTVQLKAVWRPMVSLCV